MQKASTMRNSRKNPLFVDAAMFMILFLYEKKKDVRKKEGERRRTKRLGEKESSPPDS
jgi:hypothetical protein